MDRPNLVSGPDVLTLRDRLYGEIDIPDRARRLASSCPVVLRLREVRMPNVGFVTFPSFASVTRFEHSVGVSHLAWWWARRNDLDEESGEALAIAGLYHDAATPAFSHLFEEFLRRDDFDHEEALYKLLIGRNDQPGRDHAQVFLGRGCLLSQVLPEPTTPESLLTPLGIADIVTSRIPLGEVLQGQIDLDNIDNVIRAVTAMGLVNSRETIHPYEVASALVYENGRICVAPDGLAAIARWQHLRRILYSAINESEIEFRTQATIKWAISKCSEENAELRSARAWVMSEPQLVEELRKYDLPMRLIDQVRLNNPGRLLLSAWMSDVSALLEPKSEKILDGIINELAEQVGEDVYVNFYIDKRERKLNLPRSSRLMLLDADSLLDPPTEPWREPDRPGRQPGIVGVISLPTRMPRGSAEEPGDGLTTKRHLDLDEASRVLASYLGVYPDAISCRWIGGRRGGGSDQGRLF
jgi:HD superfamily phosphohydrolase